MNTLTCRTKAGGRQGRGKREDEGKSGGRTQLEFLVEEDASRLVRALDDARDKGRDEGERKLMAVGMRGSHCQYRGVGGMLNDGKPVSMGP
jgi:hypothetical protein